MTCSNLSSAKYEPGFTSILDGSAGYHESNTDDDNPSASIGEINLLASHEVWAEEYERDQSIIPVASALPDASNMTHVKIPGLFLTLREYSDPDEDDEEKAKSESSKSTLNAAQLNAAAAAAFVSTQVVSRPLNATAPVFTPQTYGLDIYPTEEEPAQDLLEYDETDEMDEILPVDSWLYEPLYLLPDDGCVLEIEMNSSNSSYTEDFPIEYYYRGYDEIAHAEEIANGWGAHMNAESAYAMLDENDILLNHYTDEELQEAAERSESIWRLLFEDDEDDDDGELKGNFYLPDYTDTN